MITKDYLKWVLVKAIDRDSYYLHNQGSKSVTVGWTDNKAWMIETEYTDEGVKENRARISNFFTDWQHPTKEEVEVFEEVTGMKYITYYLGVGLQ